VEVPPELEPDATAGLDGHLVSFLAPASAAAEHYRGLRHAVEELRRERGLAVLAVTSPAVGDGKTTTAINLAGALGQAREARVLLVEADLRQPSVARHLGLEPTGAGGLVDAIERPRLRLPDVVVPLPALNVAVLLAGRRPDAPYELLKAPRLGQLLAEARSRYDYVIVDTPPAVPVPDCRLLEQWVDGFLVVVAAHRTRRQPVVEATTGGLGKIVGLVFNRDDRQPAQYAQYADYARRGGDGGTSGGRRGR
jgi:capsular exopolysaccharide synthesis family protein